MPSYLGGNNTFNSGAADSISADGSNVSTGAKNSTTSYQYDPMQKFLQNYLQGTLQSGQGQVPDYVNAGIQGLIQNPGAVGDIAGKQFGQIAGGLIKGLQPQFQNEQNQLRDVMRKNGQLQSGASNFETRRLIENQGDRTNNLLASNYVNLVNGLNSNVQAGVNAGVKVPASNLDSLASIYGAVSRAPLSEKTNTLSAGADTGAQQRTTSVSPTQQPSYLDQPFTDLTSQMPAGWTPGQWWGV